MQLLPHRFERLIDLTLHLSSYWVQSLIDLPLELPSNRLQRFVHLLFQLLLYRLQSLVDLTLQLFLRGLERTVQLLCNRPCNLLVKLLQHRVDRLGNLLLDGASEVLICSTPTLLIALSLFGPWLTPRRTTVGRTLFAAPCFRPVLRLVRSAGLFMA